MHTITINVRKAINFEGEQGRVFEGAWRKERKERSVVIIV